VLTHLDSQGRANMVDVTEKAVTAREAIAEARVRMYQRTVVCGEPGMKTGPYGPRLERPPNPADRWRPSALIRLRRS